MRFATRRTSRQRSSICWASTRPPRSAASSSGLASGVAPGQLGVNYAVEHVSQYSAFGIAELLVWNVDIGPYGLYSASLYFATVEPTTESQSFEITCLAAFCSSSVGNLALA